MAGPPPPRPRMHYGVPEHISKFETNFHVHPHPEGLVYVLVQSTIWVNVGEEDQRAHKYRSWYCDYFDRRREGPIPEEDVPFDVMEKAFGEGTADQVDGSEVEAPEEDEDWGAAEEMLEDEPASEAEDEAEEENDLSEEESEEDQEDPEYDPDED
ncbi:glutamic acid-rich protein-like [Eucalyptus grandis]|uniref:glutamic acid-rich protein-like n=1 Tax=Eucalyptus grandis TaxID=71139 RepID=UPI000525EEDA|nr:glutamic acid-rich protein-like [Eucalyptus grandis]